MSSISQQSYEMSSVLLPAVEQALTMKSVFYALLFAWVCPCTKRQGVDRWGLRHSNRWDFRIPPLLGPSHPCVIFAWWKLCWASVRGESAGFSSEAAGNPFVWISFSRQQETVFVRLLVWLIWSAYFGCFYAQGSELLRDWKTGLVSDYWVAPCMRLFWKWTWQHLEATINYLAKILRFRLSLAVTSSNLAFRMLCWIFGPHEQC